MNPSPENPRDPLEVLIDRTLRTQPLRRAPRSLEGRVFAELARRAALPWWRKSYAYWPAPMRAAFFVLSAVAAAALVAGLYFLSHGASRELASEVAGRFGWLSFAQEIFSAVASRALAVWHAIPPLWLYGGAAVLATAYATLLGVGAAAYRAFFAPRT
ncbi:MAG: hypothetical protein H7343_14310 [Undibacterium sp.]|nr:hypothetical protein [Opitutaceae bacterium]